MQQQLRHNVTINQDTKRDEQRMSEREGTNHKIIISFRWWNWRTRDEKGDFRGR